MRSQCPLLAFPKESWTDNQIQRNCVANHLLHEQAAVPVRAPAKLLLCIAAPLHCSQDALKSGCTSILDLYLFYHERLFLLLAILFFLKTGGSNKTCEQRFKHSWLQSSGVLISLLVVFSFLKKKWCDSASLVFLDEALFQRTKNKEHEITSLSTSNMIWRNANQGRLQHRLTHSGRAPPHPTTLVNPLLLHSTTPTHTTLRTELQHLQM